MKVEAAAMNAFASAVNPGAAFDVARVRADFPILKLKVNGRPLVFLDNAASSQMPQPVMDRWVRYQSSQHANIHRAVHYLSETATAEFEAARCKAQA
ncbi:MAG: cysteine desulfurase, partial [Burkholderiales bacterium]|nr:cysteine desulfurase [Burkholderiales bacterium]